MLARLLPAVVLVAAGFYLTQALGLPRGTAARPGAGFYPVAVGVFACVVSLAATVQAFLARRESPSVGAADPGDTGVGRRVASVALSLAGFSLVMPWIGYPPAAFAFVTVVLRGLGGGWAMALALGVVSAAASQYVFAVLLDVPLPRGPW